MFAQLGPRHSKTQLIVPFDPYVRAAKPSQSMYAAMQMKCFSRPHLAGVCYLSIKFILLNHGHAFVVKKEEFIVHNYIKEYHD